MSAGSGRVSDEPFPFSCQQKSGAPDRYAHVVLDHRACVDPYYEDVLVGPIGSTGIKNGTTKWETLEYPDTRKTAGRVRNLDADTDDTLYS